MEHNKTLDKNKKEVHKKDKILVEKDSIIEILRLMKGAKEKLEAQIKV